MVPSCFEHFGSTGANKSRPAVYAGDTAAVILEFLPVLAHTAFQDVPTFSFSPSVRRSSVLLLNRNKVSGPLAVRFADSQ